jgi:BirA family biotin operon repressor/biotin-[acetyl-CoA-carboxylase] ligase
VKFIHFDSIDSTNAEAARLAQKDEFTAQQSPIWISADRQHAGKGRRGREWVSSTGNLFCTCLIKTDGDAPIDARLSFVAALAVAKTLAHYIDPSLITIKWPNDVLVAGEKISGILLESGKNGGKNWVSVGIGINLITDPEIENYPTTHMLAHMKGHDLEGAEPLFSGVRPMIAVLAAAFHSWQDIYDQEGFEPIREAWLDRAHGIGEPVRAVLPHKTIIGTALGLDIDGGFEIQTSQDGVVKIHAGDVFF